MKPKAILTFDFEFWYNGEFLKKYQPENKDKLDDYAEESIIPLLDLLKKYNQRVTFFVLGQLAKKYPELIEKISYHKHEIASHGYSHKVLEDLGPEEFEKEISETNRIIGKIIGRRPIGFRAANFSLSEKTKWALNILNKYNFEYDSSIHPLRPSKISGQILEIPPSIGGIYFRILPFKLYIFLIKYLSKTNIPILYFHPYELFNSAPKINSAPWYKRRIKYWGIKNAWEKFEKLMEIFNFISIEQYLHENTSH